MEPSFSVLFGRPSEVLTTQDHNSIQKSVTNSQSQYFTAQNATPMLAPLQNSQHFLQSQAYQHFIPPASSTQVIGSQNPTAPPEEYSPVAICGMEFEDEVKYID